MDPLEITTALIELGFTPRRTVNILHKEDGNPKIYELTNLLHIRISVESFKSRTESLHCRKCKRIRHTKQYCLRTPRCIKCGPDHTSESCTLPRTDPCRGANCGGLHPGNYKGCEAFRKIRKIPHRATEEIKRREHSTQSLPSLNNSTVGDKTFASVLISTMISSMPPTSPKSNQPNNF